MSWPPPPPKGRKAFYFDLVERTAWTVVQAAAGAGIDLLASDELTLRAIGYAGLLAALKAIVAKQLPWTATNSASTLPERVDPPA